MEWISVKDQLPPDKYNVLMFNGKKEVIIGFLIYEPPPVGNWATHESIYINDLVNEKIGTCTHWTPLPEAPNTSAILENSCSQDNSSDSAARASPDSFDKRPLC